MTHAPAHQQAPPDDGEASGPRKSVLPFPVVGVGGSAGGMAATLCLFEHMPGAPGMAFVVVLHLSPEHESNAAAILQRATRMPVQQVTQRLPIEPDHVYVIAPGMQLSMDDGHLEVQAAERRRGPLFAIDLFFRTLAQAHGERAIAIVLSGSGSDGAVGLADVKAEGGVALAQAPGDAEFDGMPSAAITTQRVDFVLPVAEMADKLAELWENARRIELPDAQALDIRAREPESRRAPEQALQAVMGLLHTRTGHDFQHYKRGTVLRRLERRMQVTRQPTLSAYRDHLESHPEETAALLQDMLISVTHFFRDRAAFEALERELMEGLLARRPSPRQLRLWSVGCATGEEAYSLAMLLNDHAPQSLHGAFQVFASDIDERALAAARAAVYPGAILTDVPPTRLRQYFQKESDAYRVKKELREQVVFAVHNVLRDPPFSRVDVISCRNLLIYLEREVQQRVLEIFHFALNPGGVLFLGSAESADALPELFSVVDKRHRVYRANPAPQPRRELLPLLPEALRLLSPAPATVPVPVPKHPTAPLAHLHERVLYEQAPASVLVDAQHRILHTSTGAARYLRYIDGVPSRELLDVVRPELEPVLRPALLHATHTGRRVAAAPVRLPLEPAEVVLQISVRPSTGEDPKGTTFLVVFDEIDDSLAPAQALDAAAHDPVRGVLEEELRRLQGQLQGSAADSASSGEHLRAANEELRSINEELRSATEELETSKEELQSVNEELTTVNLELKSKVEELTQVNDDLSNLIVSIDIATVFVDRALRIKRFTPLASSIFNVRASDVGRALLDLTHRLEYDSLGEDMVRVFETLRPLEREVRSHDGRWYLVRISPYRTNEDRIKGVVLNCIDVSERRQAQEQLRAREERLRLVAESTPDFAIITLDAEGRVTSWNKGAELMFGYAEAEILGEPIGRLFVPEDRASGQPEAERRQAREQGRSLDERWHLRKDGSRFYCSGITTPFRDGGSEGFSKIARDLTERQLLDKQREQLLQAEQQVRRQLEAATALRSEFLAILSHELKNPLNLILMSTELLARSGAAFSQPQALRALDTIRRTVHAQSQIIDDLLDLSRIDTGKLSLTRTAVQARADVERIVQALRPEAQTRQVDLAVEAEDLVVHADAVRLEQIVWNLASNALKFTPPGGRVTVRLTRDDAYARLEVGDTGRGIEPQLLDRVFDMFVQGDGASTTRREGGLGIGLALVKHLAELHGGRVEARSAGPGRGATFSVWIPLYEGSLGGQTLQPSSASPLSGQRVLLVEDNPDALESLQMLLELQGAHVTPASSAGAALQAAAQQDFDLLVSDIAMPGMDGLQLIAELRRRPRSARWPAIAVTGFAGAADGQRAKAAGFDAHLGKPLSLEALSETFQRLQRGGG